MKRVLRPRDRAGLLERVRSLSPGPATRWGRMSVEQMEWAWGIRRKFGLP